MGSHQNATSAAIVLTPRYSKRQKLLQDYRVERADLNGKLDSLKAELSSSREMIETSDRNLAARVVQIDSLKQ